MITENNSWAFPQQLVKKKEEGEIRESQTFIKITSLYCRIQTFPN